MPQKFLAVKEAQKASLKPLVPDSSFTPVEVLNVTLQGTGIMLKNISWQLFIQPSERANISTEGVNIYFTIYVYVNLYHIHFQNNILPRIRQSCPCRY